MIITTYNEHLRLFSSEPLWLVCASKVYSGLEPLSRRVERDRELSALLSGDQGGGHQFDAAGGELGRPRRASERARAWLVSERHDCQGVFHSSVSGMGEK